MRSHSVRKTPGSTDRSVNSVRMPLAPKPATRKYSEPTAASDTAAPLTRPAGDNSRHARCQP
jgi:hypothetical protein